MKIILDKSALVAASPQILRNFTGSDYFVLIPTLRYEIATGTTATLTKCERTLPSLTGMWLAELDTLIRWEVEQGRSAQDAPTVWNTPNLLSNEFFELDEKAVEAYEAAWARLGAIKGAPEDEEPVRRLQTMRKPEFYKFLERKQGTLPLARSARLSWSREAKAQGFRVSRRFKPAPDWLCYGLQLVSETSLYWKFWRYGDSPAGQKKPANFGLDIPYVAFLSIADVKSSRDGLLSADKALLDFTSACWPQKRSGLFLCESHPPRIEPHKFPGG